MTPNQVAVHSDGICIYLVVEVRNAVLSKIALLLCNILAVGAGVATCVWGVPVLGLVALLLELVLLKYTLWNFFGKELVTVNTRVLTYQHDYGWFKTKLVTLKVNRMLHCQAFNTVKEKEDTWQYLQFGSYDENDLPCLLYQVALPVAERDTLFIQQLIDKLYVTRLAEEQMISVLHLN